METKVIIADDHSIVRMGLSSLIKQFNVQVVEEVATCNELMQSLKNDTYTHLVLDIILPETSIIYTLNYLF
jgi:DNA-binding NarL/FixJ family response regulator